MGTPMYWTMNILLMLAWTAFSSPAATPASLRAASLSLSSPYPAFRRDLQAALVTATPERFPRSESPMHISKVLEARGHKKKADAIVVFDSLSLSVFPPNWCGFVSAAPGKCLYHLSCIEHIVWTASKSLPLIQTDFSLANPRRLVP